MEHNFVYDNVSQALPKLLDQVLRNGEEVGSRAGRTKELMHVGITLRKPWQRELCATNRKANLAAQIAETMWVLSGRSDIDWLSNYLPRAIEFSDDGQTWRAGYGPRLRAWGSAYADNYGEQDQLAQVVRLLRESPGTRRAVMSIWDPALDFVESKDIPCNNWLSFSSRGGKLDLHVAIRSNDVMWGWSGINTFEWSALLEVVAGLSGLSTGSIHYSVTSFHLYDQHWERARSIESLHSPLQDSPRFKVHPAIGVKGLNEIIALWFTIEEKIRNGEPTREEVYNFPEPMMQSWLKILQWWWSGNQTYLAELQGTRLGYAASVAVQPKLREVDPADRPSDMTFIDSVCKLHNEKDAAYGNSWKKRGEMLGIMANLARKIDRLGKNGGGDTAADTAIDLAVYLAKYRMWLVDHAEAPTPIAVISGLANYSDGTKYANLLLRQVASNRHIDSPSVDMLEVLLTKNFESLEYLVMEKRQDRWQVVDAMLLEAYVLASQL